MKKKFRTALLVTAVLLAVALTASAVSDSVLSRVYTAGKELLFSTDNVTLTGTATFLLDGVRFKSVNAKYMQDGDNSRWEYGLLTPFDDEEEPGDRQSGYTIIANGEDLYTLDAYYPGSYREGYDYSPQNTLVRTSVLMNQVVNVAGAAISCLEPLMGEGAVQVIADNYTGATVRVTLNPENISDLTNAAFNLCAQMAIRRLIKPVDYDFVRERPLEHEEDDTVTEWILGWSHSYALRFADVTATLDGNGRLRALYGAVSVIPDLGDDMEDDYQPHVIDVTFNVTVANYGTTHVEKFDPEAEGLEDQFDKYGV